MIYLIFACLIGFSTCSNSTTEDGNSTTEDTNYTIDPTCPFLDHLTYDYYPGNCSKFYECDHGKKYLMECPAGLYWNAVHNYCDYLENVDCSREDLPTGVTNDGSTGTTATTICADEANGTLLPNPNDCSKFYECLAGQAVEFSCPDGTLFDETKNRCDYAENVDC